MSRLKYYILGLLICIFFTGCGNSADEANKYIENNFTVKSSLELDAAKNYTVDYLDNGLVLICINGSDYLLYDESNQYDFSDLPKSITYIGGPLDSIYVVGTGSMDFFVEAGALDQVKYTSLQPQDWNLEAVRKQMEQGKLTYAGKYSAPDVELLLANGTDLIVENTMITHSPEILTQLQELGFSCMVDNSSLEDSVFGRMEWIKLYGILTGHYEEALQKYQEQKNDIESISKEELSNNTVAYFSITAAGTVSIRKNDDYICNMIRLANGQYAFDNLNGNEGTGSTTIQMDSFYELAKDCDVLIYNGTIEGDISSIDELISKNDLLKNFKAVNEGNVYCTSDSLYQSVMKLGDITKDINKILTGQDDYTYLVKLK